MFLFNHDEAGRHKQTMNIDARQSSRCCFFGWGDATLQKIRPESFRETLAFEFNSVTDLGVSGI
jgi:hypothetical protein